MNRMVQALVTVATWLLFEVFLERGQGRSYPPWLTSSETHKIQGKILKLLYETLLMQLNFQVKLTLVITDPDTTDFIQWTLSKGTMEFQLLQNLFIGWPGHFLPNPSKHITV